MEIYCLWDLGITLPECLFEELSRNTFHIIWRFMHTHDLRRKYALSKYLFLRFRL